MVSLIAKSLDRIVEVAHSSGVRRMWIFGSGTGRGSRSFDLRSDVDFIVEFDESRVQQSGWMHPLFHLGEMLEPIVGRSVHLAELHDQTSPLFRSEVERTRELIYDADRHQALVGHP